LLLKKLKENIYKIDMLKNKLLYKEEKNIPYYEQTQKRTFFEKIRKIKNTIFLLLAYACPSVKLRILFHRLRGVNIGKGCYIGLFCFIDNLYPEYIYFEDGVGVNSGSMIIAHFNPSLRFKGVLQAKVSPIIIKEGALIAVRCVILPGVVIGKNAIVSAGSVVTDDVEEETLVRGNPAKKVGHIRIKLN
jgi:acetyltransferase-like isoleucine patch superfamily enzyme